MENGFFEAVLGSLARRLPVQPDFVMLLLKFLQTLTLNPQGTQLIIESGILPKFALTACDPAAHKHLVNPNKVMNYSEAT